MKQHTCILSPQVTSQLIHEAVGHMAEADFRLACGFQSPFLRLPSMSNKITIMDYAHTAFGEACPIPMYFDDEGTPAVDVCIIKKGKMGSCMTNKYTADALSIPLTGNARASQVYNEPIVRMRNTALLPHNDDLAGMIASTNDGYFLEESDDAFGDVNGDFACKIKSGYVIKNGELCKPIEKYIVIGKSAEFLASISMVGNDFKWYLDECSKWQTIKVGQGAPSIKAVLKIGVE